MTEPAQYHHPETDFRRALDEYDASKAGGSAKEIALAEKRLTEILPSGIFDIFALAPRLADKTISQEVRDKLIANMIRSTKFIDIEFQNVIAWAQARERTIANYRNSYEVAVSSLGKVQEGVGVARSILDAVAGAPNPVLAEAACELAATRALFEIANLQIHDPVIDEILAKNAAERQVFEEVLKATTQ